MNNKTQQWYLKDTAAMESMNFFLERMSETDDLIKKLRDGASGSNFYLYVHEDAWRMGKFNDIYHYGTIIAYEWPKDVKTFRKALATCVNNFTRAAKHVDGSLFEAVLGSDYRHDYIKWLMKDLYLITSQPQVHTYNLEHAMYVDIPDDVDQDWVRNRVVNCRRGLALETFNMLHALRYARDLGDEALLEEIATDPFYRRGITKAWFYSFVPAFALLDDVEVHYAD